MSTEPVSASTIITLNTVSRTTLVHAQYELLSPVLLMLTIQCDKKEEFWKTQSVHLKVGRRSWVAEEVFHKA